MNPIKKLLHRAFNQQLHLLRTYVLEYSPNATYNKNVIDRYMCLPLPECKSLVSYVWIDGTGTALRYKTKTMNFVPNSYKEVPTWTVNGYTSFFTKTPENSDLYICPIAMYKDPIRRGNHRLVLCETYKADHKKTDTNKRRGCIETLNKACEYESMFGFEQEYHLFDYDARPLGWPVLKGEPKRSVEYDCSVGSLKCSGTDVMEAHYRACLYAGIEISGAKSEVNLSQWEFKTGPTPGIKAGDDLWMARFILHRVADEFGIAVSFHPKPHPEFAGSGCHLAFSTKDMRNEGGIKDIEAAVEKLSKSHEKFLSVCDPMGGKMTRERLVGAHQASKAGEFTSGVADRTKSVRIPSIVQDMKKGHLEDRRPSANCDPYSVMEAIVDNLLVEC